MSSRNPLGMAFALVIAAFVGLWIIGVIAMALPYLLPLMPFAGIGYLVVRLTRKNSLPL